MLSVAYRRTDLLEIRNAPGLPMKLTSSQLGLLRLFCEEPGQSLPEIQQHGPCYGAPVKSFLLDFATLLEHRLVWPVGRINPDTFLPGAAVTTDLGNQTLEIVGAGEPGSIPPIDHECLANIDHDPSLANYIFGAEDPGNYPELFLGSLANSYLHWALQPPGEIPRSPSEGLARAAAFAYARLKKPIPFARAVRCAFGIWVNRGDYLEVRSLLTDIVSRYPKTTSLMLELVYLVIHHPYERLHGSPLPPLLSDEDAITTLDEMRDLAKVRSQDFQLHMPDGQLISEIATRTADLFEEAFRVQSKPLFNQSLGLMSLQLKMVASMLRVDPSKTTQVLQEEHRSRVNSVKQIVQALEGYAPLTTQNANIRQTACRSIQEVLRNVHHFIVQPVASMIAGHGEEMSPVTENSLQSLLLVEDESFRSRLVDPMLRLDRLLAEIGQRTLDQESTLSTVLPQEAVARRQIELAKHIERLTVRDLTPSTFTHVYRWDILDHVIDLLKVAETQPENLFLVCKDIRNDPQLLPLINGVLDPYIDTMKEDLERIARSVKEDPNIPAEPKAEILKGLSALREMTRAGTVLVDTPTIPHLWFKGAPHGVRKSWNAWLDKLHTFTQA